MPRKKKPENLCRKNIICLKLSDFELELPNRRASTVGLSRSEFFRKGYSISL